MKYLIAYVPVLHKGYLNLFEQSEADILFLISDELILSLPNIDYVSRKDSIRAVPDFIMKSIVQELGFFESVHILDKTTINNLFSEGVEVDIIMPYEDVSRILAKEYFSNKVKFLPIFLRWNKQNVDVLKKPESTKLSFSDFQKNVLKIVVEEAEKSLDWWRQVGAVIVKNEHILLVGHNKHFPLDQGPNIFGDPRAIFKKGISIDLSTAEHAEASLVAEAARRGICLEGSHIYTTDFPCPPCAKLIARSGITKCFYMRGYAMLDGEDILKNAGVEIICIVFD